MKTNTLVSYLTLAALCVLPAIPARAQDNVHNLLLPVEKQNHAYRWLNIAQESIAREIDKVGARPTIISRQHAIWATSMYDAWAAYDDKAVGTRLGATLRRPKKERTLENKQKAISYASYSALLSLFPGDKSFLDAAMKKFGYDPEDKSTDPKTAAGIRIDPPVSVPIAAGRMPAATAAPGPLLVLPGR